MAHTAGHPPRPPGTNPVLDFLNQAARNISEATTDSSSSRTATSTFALHEPQAAISASEFLAALERLLSVCVAVLKVPTPSSHSDEHSQSHTDTQALVETCIDGISTTLDLAERSGLASAVRIVCGPQVFYAVALHCSPSDPWSSSNTTNGAHVLLDRFWRLAEEDGSQGDSLRYPAAILDEAVKPRLAGLRRSAIDGSTGRRAKQITHRALEAVADGVFVSSARVELGLWNAVEQVAMHAKPAQLEALWSRLVPPTVILLEDSGSLCKIAGARVAKIILEKADCALIMRTGLDTVLEKLFELSYTIIDADAAADLMLQTLHAQLALVDKTAEWDPRREGSNKSRSSPGRSAFARLHRLVEAALLHVAAYASISTDKQALQLYMCEGIALVVPRIGLGVARYLQFFVPYLCQILTSVDDMVLLEPVGRAIDVLQMLRTACPARIVHWEGQITVAGSLASAKLREAPRLSTGLVPLCERLEGLLSPDMDRTVRVS